jgi:peptide-methionine (R)-S-oxide reductase
MSIARAGNPEPPRRVEKPDAEWRAELSAEQFHVLREHGTERAFSSGMCSLFEPGRYACAGCGTLLFDSASKFESGTGWPSFGEPVADNVIAYLLDTSYGMTRVEVTCNVCGGHQGHVFPDGPPPTGLRYCINAVSLQKEASE